MALSANTRKFESLNFFIHDRLKTTAEEIFQVVKETLAEIQEEIHHFKQENIYLKERLAQISSRAPDVQIKQDRFFLEEQNSQQSPLDSAQVKLELGNVQWDPETRPRLTASSVSSAAPAATAQRPPHIIMGKIVDCEGHGEVGACMDTSVLVKLESCGFQGTCSGKSSSNAVRNESGNNHVEVQKEEPGLLASPQSVQSSGDVCQPSSHVENSLTPFQSGVCAESFKNYSLLKTHMGTHQEEKVYCCQFCGQCYSHNNLLKNHLRTHTGEKQYHCKFCDKTFSCKGHVKDHEKIHTDEKPYICGRCGKCFVWLSQAKLHIQNDHSGQPAAVIKKATKHGILKMVHQNVNEYHCEVCGKSYVSQPVLRKHLRIHTGERPFKCRFCSKTFKQKVHMTEHERIHTGEKKYSCSECGLGFIWLRQAKVHVQNRHDERAEVVRI